MILLTHHNTDTYVPSISGRHFDIVQYVPEFAEFRRSWRQWHARPAGSAISTNWRPTPRKRRVFQHSYRAGGRLHGLPRGRATQRRKRGICWSQRSKGPDAPALSFRVWNL